MRRAPETRILVLILIVPLIISLGLALYSSSARQIPVWLAIAGVLLTALLLILGYVSWAKHAVALPLRQIIAVVNRLGDGDLQARVRVSATGGIDALGDAVNRTAVSMERSQRDLNQQIEQSTWELRETLEAVEIQNVELDTARKHALVGSRVKSEFLANMSHEIRTPINGILGFADLLSHSRLDEEQQDHIVTIKKSCANLLFLVNDILDFSRMEAGKQVIDSVPFDLRDCVEEVVTLMAPAAYNKNLELVQLIFSDVPVMLYGDPVRIRQILTNLVHNAIKFTSRGSVVLRVMLDRESDQVAHLRITITDTGIGMTASEQENLFQAFGQADTSITRRFGGAGLGLIICQKLLEQMGGSIGLESQPDQGSVFWFTLPCSRQSGGNTASPKGRTNPLSGLRVLLHDQSVLSRLATRHVLESWNMVVVETEERQRLIALLTQEDGWDLGVMGLNREQMDCRLPEIKVPLIVLASTVDRDELNSLYRQGAGVCLSKTVQRRILFRELCRIISPEQAPLQRQSVDDALMPSQSSRQLPFSGIRALVVDDNGINRKLVSSILTRHGVAVDEAVNGRESLVMAASAFYDLIFMDIHMPAMSGETAFFRIREHQTRDENFSRIVAVTANALPGERERMLKLGMHECLIKPITEQQVLAQVRLTMGMSDDEAKAEYDGISASRALKEDLYGMLVAELPNHRRAVMDRYRGGDLTELRNEVHRLRGAASVCRVPELQEACKKLEDAIMKNRRVDIPGGMDRVLSEIDTLLATTGS